MKEILIALLVAAAYLLGAVLYYFTRDELVWKDIGNALRKADTLLAAVYGGIMFSLTYFQAMDWAAALFIIVLVQSALASIGLKGKLAIKTAVIQLMVFLMFFFALYLLI